MNRNSKVNTTVELTDGRLIVIRHRNSFGGFVNELERWGFTWGDVTDSFPGLPEENRVEVTR